jgi:hypothetical protein
MCWPEISRHGPSETTLLSTPERSLAPHQWAACGAALTVLSSGFHPSSYKSPTLCRFLATAVKQLFTAAHAAFARAVSMAVLFIFDTFFGNHDRHAKASAMYKSGCYLPGVYRTFFRFYSESFSELVGKFFVFGNSRSEFRSAMFLRCAVLI